MQKYSHSLLDVARKCMTLYKFKYVDKIKLKNEDTSAADFGSFVHEVAERYKGSGRDELLALKHESDITIPLNEELSLTGKIDIVVIKDGRYRIVDYKTSKSNKYGDHSNQLAMYMLLLNRKYGISYDKMDCEIIYLALDSMTKKGEAVPNEGYKNISKVYKLEEMDVECLLSEIDMINKRIKKSIDKGEWAANPTWFNCTYCDFHTICPHKFSPPEEKVLAD